VRRLLATDFSEDEAAFVAVEAEQEDADRVDCDQDDYDPDEAQQVLDS
jgi:hypothetical protein